MFSRKRIERVESESATTENLAAEETYSLEDLGSAYARVLDSRENRQDVRENESSEANSSQAQVEDELEVDSLLNAPTVGESDHVPITPESILEAMLFVGASDNQPLEVNRLVEILKGTTVDDIHAFANRLNRRYREQDRAFDIVYETGGFKLQLAQNLALIRDRFYGKVKETQLSQAAIDCLSLVAYQPGITQAELEVQWNQPAGMTLSTLVRKGLLRIDNEGSHRTKPKYFTTERFLEIVGLHSLNDLPHSEEL